MTKTCAFLFDLDGTLAETAPDLGRALNYVLAQNGLADVPLDAVRDMVSGGAAKILQCGLRFHNATWGEAQLAQGVEDFVGFYADHIADETYLFDGVVSFLRTAQARNIPMAVVTNKRADLAANLLHRLGIATYFSVLYGGDSVAKKKPAPDMLFSAARALDCAPHHCVMIGDSEADAQAAQAAKMKCLLVTFGYSYSDVKQLGVDGVIAHYDELRGAISALRPELNFQ